VFYKSAACSVYNLNDIYGTEENQFTQAYSSEVLFLVDMPWKNATQVCVDSNNTGGRYSLGIIKQTGEDDLTSMVFDKGSYTYVNFQMDISTMGLSEDCGSSVLELFDDPALVVTAFDSPDGIALLGGNVLDSQVMPCVKGPNNWTYVWYTGQVTLDVRNATASTVSIMWEVQNGGSGVGYMALLDNVLIIASNILGF
jgi:hypothetical protein